MKILLRILVVLVLSLSAASLFLGINLFLQREILKGRTYTLEEFAIKISEYIELPKEDVPLIEQDRPIGGVPRPELKKYFRRDNEGKAVTQIDPATGKKVRITDGEGTMQIPLNALMQRAKSQLGLLNETRGQLETTQNELQDTKDDLSQTSIKLEEKKATLAGKEAEIEDQDARIIELQVDIATKEEYISGLNEEITAKDNKITRMVDKAGEDALQITQQKKRIADQDRKIAQWERGTGRGETLGGNPTTGDKGVITKVNPKWNFVVIDVVPDSKLSRNHELLVQRKANFVGKVRILQVKTEENVAIADILPFWLQMPIQKGDRVVFQ